MTTTQTRQASAAAAVHAVATATTPTALAEARLAAITRRDLGAVLDCHGHHTHDLGCPTTAVPASDRRTFTAHGPLTLATRIGQATRHATTAMAQAHQ